MELISIIIGIIVGYLIAFVVFSYFFYNYKKRQVRENLKLYTEMRELIRKIESTTEVVDSTVTDEMLNYYVSIEGDSNGNHS